MWRKRTLGPSLECIVQLRAVPGSLQIFHDNLYFQLNYAEDSSSSNNKLKQTPNDQRQSLAFFLSCEALIASSGVWGHGERKGLLGRQLSHLHSLGHFSLGLLGEGQLWAGPACGYTGLLQGVPHKPPALCLPSSDPAKDSSVR